MKSVLPAWEFDILLKDNEEKVGSIKIHKGTGRWTQQLEDDGWSVTRHGVYAYEATITTNQGKFNTYCTRNTLLKYRKAGAAYGQLGEA
ncbi:MAG TPA: hypothetical protein VH593_10180 [Ktedonobacteraceae bacterium]